MVLLSKRTVFVLKERKLLQLGLRAGILYWITGCRKGLVTLTYRPVKYRHSNWGLRNTYPYDLSNIAQVVLFMDPDSWPGPQKNSLKFFDFAGVYDGAA